MCYFTYLWKREYYLGYTLKTKWKQKEYYSVLIWVWELGVKQIMGKWEERAVRHLSVVIFFLNSNAMRIIYGIVEILNIFFVCLSSF